MRAEFVRSRAVVRVTQFSWGVCRWIGLLVWGAGPLYAATSQLTVRLVDPTSKESIPGWFRILGADEAPLSFESLYSRGTGLRANHPARSWYSVDQPTTITVPKGEVYVEAVSGVNSERVRRKLDFRFFDRLSVTLPLPTLLPLEQTGWYQGNTHLHLQGLSREEADQYLQVVPRSDRLDLLFVSHLERVNEDEGYISNVYRSADFQLFSQSGVLFENGEEHRHNFGPWDEGYGHVMFLKVPQLIQPVSIGKGITGAGYDFPPLRKGIDQARAGGSTVVWCHNRFGLEDIPNWLGGRVDAQNIFDGGSHGSYAASFYSYLDVGLAVPFSTGTDWFIYDYSRVFVLVEGTLNSNSWLDGLRAGRSFITNGPLLEFSVEEAGIGERINLEHARDVAVRGNVAGRSDFGSIELMLNGKAIEQVGAIKKGNRYVAELSKSVLIDRPAWLALRVSGGGLDTDGNVIVPAATPLRGTSPHVNEMGEALFAHTSPIYVDFKHRSRFEMDVAEELIAAQEAAIELIRDRGDFESLEQREEVLVGYQEGIQWLRRKMSAESAK